MTKQRSIVADRIEDLLRIKDMTVADLSRLSKVSESALSNILSGSRKQPRADTIQKIANAFPTSTDYLNGKTDNHEPNNAPDLPLYAAEVLESMRKLDQARNYELFIVAKGFVEASEQIRRISRQQVIDMMLDYGDAIAGPEETDRVMKLLQKLDEKLYGPDDDDSLFLASSEPSDPGE